MELKLFYQTLLPPKELYWNHRITTELSKFSSIKYARPTFAVNNGTFQRERPKLDLILASSDVQKLATVLFNLRAFIMSGKASQSTVTMSTGIQANKEEISYLEQKHSRLIDAWSGDTEAQDSPFLRLQPDSNLLFAKRPVRCVNTTEDEDVNVSNGEFFKLHYNQHERRNAALVDEYSQPPIKKGDGQYGPNLIHFKPSLYYTYSSLPASMKLWLDGLEDNQKTLMEINDKSAENLDILLHGFKGFPYRNS